MKVLTKTNFQRSARNSKVQYIISRYYTKYVKYYYVNLNTLTRAESVGRKAK